VSFLYLTLLVLVRKGVGRGRPGVLVEGRFLGSGKIGGINLVTVDARDGAASDQPDEKTRKEEDQQDEASSSRDGSDDDTGDFAISKTVSAGRDASAVCKVGGVIRPKVGLASLVRDLADTIAVVRRIGNEEDVAQVAGKYFGFVTTADARLSDTIEGVDAGAFLAGKWASASAGLGVQGLVGGTSGCLLIADTITGVVVLPPVSAQSVLANLVRQDALASACGWGNERGVGWAFRIDAEGDDSGEHIGAGSILLLSHELLDGNRVRWLQETKDLKSILGVVDNEAVREFYILEGEPIVARRECPLNARVTPRQRTEIVGFNEGERVADDKILGQLRRSYCQSQPQTSWRGSSNWIVIVRNPADAGSVVGISN
jgi:hypothetical protein